MSDVGWIEAAKRQQARAEKAEALNADLLEALHLILPLAKGYAAAHKVGSNAEYIKAAEAACAKAEPQKEDGDG